MNQIYCMPGGDAFELENSTSGYARPADWLVQWHGGGRSTAGVHVNGYTALTHCPLWQGVNILAGDVGQVGIRLVRNGFDEQRNHPAWNLLRVAPNGLQTPRLWKETVMLWSLIHGNAVCLIKRRGSRPVALIPLRPDYVDLEVVSFLGEEIAVYSYRDPYSGQEYKFLPDDVLHFQGLTCDGLWGYPLWLIARDCIGYGLALQQHGASVFSNGAVPNGVLEAPIEARGIAKDKDARQNLRQEWNEVHRGPDRAGTIAILWEGIKYRETSKSNVDSQWLEAKKLGVYEAAALLSLPPHKLGALQDSSVRANLEEQNQDYAQRSLNRHFNAHDEEFRRKLLTYDEWQSDEFEFRHDVDEFLRGDIDTLTQIGDRCVKGEILNRNEARALIGYKPYHGGDKFGSPAINPQPRGGDAGGGDGHNGPDGGPNEGENGPVAAQNRRKTAAGALRKLVVDRVAHLLDCESQRVAHAAANSKKFITWLDDFYLGDDAQFAHLARKLLGGPLSDGKLVGIDGFKVYAGLRTLAEERHAACLEAAGHVTQDALPTEIGKVFGRQHEAIARRIVQRARTKRTRKPLRRAA